eukprot:gene17495-biopygen17335
MVVEGRAAARGGGGGRWAHQCAPAQSCPQRTARHSGRGFGNQAAHTCLGKTTVDIRGASRTATYNVEKKQAHPARSLYRFPWAGLEHFRNKSTHLSKDPRRKIPGTFLGIP